jgi:inhibitor of KinA sporulation pathway (predicted exonuclease)
MDYLVIDLEATCDDAHRIPRAQTEIIEIGAVLVDGETLEPLEEFQTFVRPIVHRRLTDFCTRLTSIRQVDVDTAPLFPAALAQLTAFIGATEMLFCSWGDYDRQQFTQDAARHRLTLPFRGGHLNVKRAFSERLGEARQYGMAGALRRAGLPLAGTHHRGIDDARNIARLLPWALGSRGAKAAG